jgi:hypothetical protein
LDFFLLFDFRLNTNFSTHNFNLDNALLSHREAHNRGLIVEDISNREVNARRSSITIDGISLHEYVCFYFSPRNPMLYALRHIQNEIILIGVAPQLLLHSSTIFSDGNAAADDTKFYRGTSMLDNLDWDIINAVYWNNYHDGRRIKCAEILVRTKVGMRYIKRIFCFNDNQLDIVQKTFSEIRNQCYTRSGPFFRCFGTRDHIATEINRGLYFLG